MNSTPNTFRFAVSNGRLFQVVSMDRRRRRNVITGRTSEIAVERDAALAMAKLMKCSVLVRVRPVQ